MPTIPETQYAQSGDLSIAYQVVGEGPPDILFVPGFVSNVELMWDRPSFAHLFGRLASIGRFVVFDKRGTGCSDRTLGTGSSEDRMDDLRAVADAAGIDSAVVIGISEGGPLAVLFAASFPERVTSLVLWGTFARALRAPDYEEGMDEETVNAFIDGIQSRWGTGTALAGFLSESPDEDQAALARYERQTATPGAVATILRHNVRMDVRHALGSLRMPTLVIHREGDPIVPVAAARYLARHIENARIQEFPGDFHVGGNVGDDDDILDAIEEFVTGAPVERESDDVDRVLMTVLFTDIVDSTRQAAELGDKAWRALLEQHDSTAAKAVESQRGVVVKRTGDGLLATFDGPGRGVRAARALREAVASLGVEVRAGLHTGEVERRGDDVAGIGVHIGSRVSALAEAGEVLVTSTVKDLVMGSDLEFDDRGARELKGVPGDWHLWASV
ncbi:MAG TPA: adenylate/guanylate cyclase domain-containing protein [Acidimicrobiia bacterium]|nr:adenylate/guanylate cyclase domain-containing protein [Acidimicrobiia bacterium]